MLNLFMRKDNTYIDKKSAFTLVVWYILVDEESSNNLNELLFLSDQRNTYPFKKVWLAPENL